MDPENRSREEIVEFNPIEVQKHLKGINYPVTKEGLSGPDDVQAALKRT